MPHLLLPLLFSLLRFLPVSYHIPDTICTERLFHPAETVNDPVNCINNPMFFDPKAGVGGPFFSFIPQSGGWREFPQ